MNNGGVRISIEESHAKVRSGFKEVGVIPDFLGTATFLPHLVEALKRDCPSAIEISEFLLRASQATPQSAKKAVRRISGGLEKFSSALGDSQCTYKGKISQHQTTQAISREDS